MKKKFLFVLVLVCCMFVVMPKKVSAYVTSVKDTAWQRKTTLNGKTYWGDLYSITYKRINISQGWRSNGYEIVGSQRLSSNAVAYKFKFKYKKIY
ncbi:hypothetical protein I6N95_04285 [Vagococcus sp. BWB3-3]|uniref:Uncharacterized protein n=1 Tax=Vagococcus allomyrinae TaxID=2794353 RepID=A0A940SUN0_9ENTE|nr:hypothetical protein [Vagococcus allomyrinae]MBP1040226.1 hypothetical protein [Vagococcus allomyrinae]